MNSIFKVTMKHMMSHKLRGFMILLSILLSGGLVYAVMNMNLFTEDILLANMKKEYGTASLLVFKEDMSLIEEEFDTFEDVTYQINATNVIGYAQFESNYAVNMMAFEDNQFEEIYTVTYLEKEQREQGIHDVIIAEENARYYDLQLGDSLITTINGVEYTFTVYGVVSEGTTFLDYSTNTLDIVVSDQFITEELEITKPNIVLFQAPNDDVQQQLVTAFAEYEVLNMNDDSMFEGMDTINSFLVLMASSVILISAFIIYSTYKIIVIERLPFIGTLRSIGANKQFGVKALFTESILYGVIGGVLGVGMGVLFLDGIFTLFFGDTDFSMIEVSYLNLGYAALTIICATILSVISSLVPIMQVRTFTIKQVMFGEIKNIKEVKYRNIIIGVIMLITAVVLILSINKDNETLFSMSAMLFTVIGLTLFIPVIIRVVSPVFTWLLYPLFKNRVLIASKNIKYDKTLINNIVLLATGLGVIFMINNFSASVGNIVLDVYNQAQFDVVLQDIDVEDELVEQIKTVEGVEHVYTMNTIMGVETTDNYTLDWIQGVDLEAYHEYAWDDFKEVLNPSLLQVFEQEDTIIITNFTARKYGIEVGDTITFQFQDQRYDVTVLETVSSVLYNGNLNFISETTYQSIFGEEGSQSVYLNTPYPEQVKNDVKALYMYGVLPVETLDDMERVNNEGNDMIFTLMKAISLLAMLIGAVGIVNNFTVSFIARRQLIANLRSLGLSIKGTVTLFLVESILTGLIGSTIGVIMGIAFYYVMGFVVEAMNITAELLQYSLPEMTFVFISGLFISVLAALLPAINIAKRNIVQEIKYEG